MLIKLVGYAHKEGKFTDKETGELIDFNNVVLDVLTDAPLDNDCVKAQNGLHCSSIKVKFAQLRTLFPPEIKSVTDLNNWLNKEIVLDYSLLGAKPVLVGIRLK